MNVDAVQTSSAARKRGLLMNHDTGKLASSKLSTCLESSLSGSRSVGRTKTEMINPKHTVDQK